MTSGGENIKVDGASAPRLLNMEASEVPPMQPECSGSPPTHPLRALSRKGAYSSQ